MRILTRTIKFVHKLSISIDLRSITTSFYKDVPLLSQTVPDFIFENVDKFENKIAVHDDISKVNYTYRDVRQITKNVCSGLIKHNDLRKGDVVSIVLPNCPEYIFALLGIMSTGAIATMTNPAMTASEMKYQMELSNSKLIITATPFLPTVLEAIKEIKAINAIYLVDQNVGKHGSFYDDLMNDKGDALPDGKQLAIDAKEDVCIMPSSSGTTGFPKGVMLTHSNITMNLQQLRAMQEVNEGNENYLLQLPMYHGYGFQIIAYFGLRYGCKLITSPKFQPEEYLPLIEKNRITLLHLVPPQVLFLLDRKDFDKFDLKSVKKVLVAGSPIDEESLVALTTKFSRFSSDFDIIQGYGLTESILITTSPPQNHRKRGKQNSVGVVLPNISIKIVDLNGKEVNSGETGELVVKGPQIMKGYINNPEATQNCIKEGWLHTGDLGYVDNDGYVFIQDRLKELIKYKGFQVAPAELEGVLVSHPQISQACVVGKPDREAGELPHAFVKKIGDLTEKDVEIYVAERVASFKKLRGGVTFVDSIPCSPSGKILRRELRKLLQ